MEKMTSEQLSKRKYENLHKIFDDQTDVQKIPKDAQKETQKDTPKTFKWGDKEYLLDDLLKLHTQYENNYYQFAKERGSYDDEALAQLRAAIKNRIQAVKDGRSFEGDGVLDSDQVKNISIKQKGLFKKDKYVEQDVTEWAKHYLNKLMSKMKTHNPTKSGSGSGSESGAWDLSKHGLGSYLTGQGISAQDVFEKYDLFDKNNPTNPRTLTQRRELLKSHLQNYKTWLENKNFDFTKNDNEWDDNFVEDLNKLLSSYDNLSDSDLAAALRKLGAGDQYTMAFTSTNWDANTAQIQAQAQAQKEAEARDAADPNKQAQKAWEKEKERRYNIYNQLDKKRSGQMTQYIGKDKNFEATDEDLKYYLENTKLNGKTQKQYLDEQDAKYKNNPYNASIAQIVLPLKAKQGLLKDITEGDYAGWSYDPSTLDENRQSVLAFNKTTGKLEEIFIGHATDAWQELKSKYLQKANPQAQGAAAFNREGGILQYQTGGNFSSYDLLSQYQDVKTEEKAAKTGNTKEVQKARDRIVSNGDQSFKSEDPSLASPDAGFTAAEYARLGTIVADITSMFLDPVSGAAVGASSSIVNFGADVADDGFQMKDVGNLLVNLGFDAVGLIPVVGDAIGTGSKIVKQCVKLAPKVLTGLAAYQGIANFGGMTESWKKLMSGDKDQKLTVQDWRNIAQSIGLLTGTVRGVKAHRSAKKMKQQAKVDDTVSVTIENKKTGKQEQVLVAGDQAAKIKEAKGEAGKINEILNGIDQYKGKFGENGDLTVATKTGGLQIPFGRNTNADGSKSWGWKGFTGEGRAKVNDVYDFTRVQQQNGWGWRPFGQPDAARAQMAQRVGGTDPAAIANARQRVQQNNPNNPKSNANSSLNDKAVKNVIDGYTKDLQAAMDRRTKKQAEIDQELQKTEKSIQDQELNFQRRQLESENNLLRQQNNLTQELNKATTTLKRAQTKKNKAVQHAEDCQQAFENLRDQIKNNPAMDTPENNKILEGYKQQVSQANVAKASAQRAYDTAKSRLQDLQTQKSNNEQAILDLPNQQHNTPEYQQARINQQRLKKLQEGLSQKPHTNAYRRLQDYLDNLNKQTNVTSGNQPKYDMQQILQDAGIKNAFKQGGNINIYKLNEFLNYAKG